jgi:hypothetical protein
MADPVYVIGRRARRIERLHDEQDRLLSFADMERCNHLKTTFNDYVDCSLHHNKNKELRVVIEVPTRTSEAALLCFVYATKRAGERPILDGLDANGGMKHGGLVIFPEN